MKYEPHKRLPADSGPDDIQQARRWTAIVWCVTILVAGFFALYIQSAEAATLDAAQRYADKVTGPAGIASVVVTRKLGGKRYRGSSEIGIRAGKMELFRIVLNTHMLDEPEHIWQNTVRHEACHLMVAKRLGYVPTPYHNSDFKRCARRLGVANDYIAD